MELDISFGQRLAIIITFFIYTAAIVAVSLWAKRSMDKAAVDRYVEEFYTGGRGLGVLAVAFMIAAGLCGAGTFVGSPGLAYKVGGPWLLINAAQIFVTFVVLGEIGKKIGIVARRIDWTISEIGRADPLIGMEQREGHRLDTSSIPGPFIIKPKNQDLDHASVLEIVPRNQIDEYIRLSSVIPALMLRDSFADLTLIFTPLDSKRKPSVLFCWSCHCIADGEANKQEMQNHMERAIDRLNISKKARAFGVAFISARELDLDANPQKSFVLPLSIDVSDWSMNIDKINWALQELIGEIL